MELPADELADAAQLLSALATAPAPRAAPPPAPSAQPLALLAPGHLRCLDPSHDGGCTRRVPSGRDRRLPAFSQSPFSR